MKNLEQLANDLEKIAELVREASEPEIEEGQYWEDEKSGNIYRIEGKSDYPTQEYKSKAINFAGCDYTHWRTDSLLDKCTLLSDSEVQQALIEEAEWRGLLEDGVEFRWEHSKNRITKPGSFDKVRYQSYSDYLVAEDEKGTFLYQRGNWPEIIEDEWEVIEEPFRQVTNGERCISTISPVPLPKEEAETIAKALNR